MRYVTNEQRRRRILFKPTLQADALVSMSRRKEKNGTARRPSLPENEQPFAVGRISEPPAEGPTFDEPLPGRT